MIKIKILLINIIFVQFMTNISTQMQKRNNPRFLTLPTSLSKQKLHLTSGKSSVNYNIGESQPKSVVVLQNNCPSGLVQPIFEEDKITETYCRCDDNSYGFTCLEGIKNPCVYGGQYYEVDTRIPKNYFIECSWETPYLMKCPKGTYWNQELLTCDYSSKGQGDYSSKYGDSYSQIKQGGYSVNNYGGDDSYGQASVPKQELSSAGSYAKPAYKNSETEYSYQTVTPQTVYKATEPVSVQSYGQPAYKESESQISYQTYQNLPPQQVYKAFIPEQVQSYEQTAPSYQPALQQPSYQTTTSHPVYQTPSSSYGTVYKLAAISQDAANMFYPYGY